VARRHDDGTLYHTDQANLILDTDFGPLEDAYDLAARLEGRAGIVEHGLFLNLATDVIVAGEGGVYHLQRT
jgi:ribose 5-phosphate isomerase A